MTVNLTTMICLFIIIVSLSGVMANIYYRHHPKRLVKLNTIYLIFFIQKFQV